MLMGDAQLGLRPVGTTRVVIAIVVREVAAGDVQPDAVAACPAGSGWKSEEGGGPGAGGAGGVAAGGSAAGARGARRAAPARVVGGPAAMKEVARVPSARQRPLALEPPAILAHHEKPD